MGIAPYVLDERGTSLAELLDVFTRHGYRFYHEQTRQPLPSNAADYAELIADGESINVIARAG